MSGACCSKPPSCTSTVQLQVLVHLLCKAPAKAQLRATDFSQLLYRQYTPVKSQNVLKPKREHCQRCQSAVFPSIHKGLPSCRRRAFGPPLGHPNSLKIAPARALRAQVRARAPLNAKKPIFGCPTVPEGAKMEANGSLKCTQNRSFEKKCRKLFGPIIYYIFSLSAPSENLTF